MATARSMPYGHHMDGATTELTGEAGVMSDALAFRRLVRTRIEEVLGDDFDGAILFGSRARGDATADSDWDVLVALREEADEEAARRRLLTLRVDLIGQAKELVQFFVIKWSAANDDAPLLLNVLEDGQRL